MGSRSGGQPGQQIALWGTFLQFEHPTLREPMAFHAPPPDVLPWAGFPIPHENTQE